MKETVDLIVVNYNTKNFSRLFSQPPPVQWRA